VKILEVIASCAFLVVPAVSQSPSTNTTSGSCSPIAPDNHGTITINCSDKEYAQRVIPVLERLLKFDPTALMTKLDECVKGIQDVKGWPELDQAKLNKTFQDAIGNVPAQRVLIEANNGDADPSRLVLAKQLKEALKSAHWTDVYVSNPISSAYTPQDFTPVTPQGITVLAKEETASANALLIAVLQTFGVIRPSRHLFFSLMRTGPGIDDYEAPYWTSRGHARFYRYVKSDPCFRKQSATTAGCSTMRFSSMQTTSRNWAKLQACARQG
jgi:hypothetical protein